MSPALTLTDVACTRGDQVLFSGVSAAVDAGRLLRVRGANGAGKTTLLRSICGLSPLTAGRIAWKNASVAALRETGGLAYVGHAQALKADLSAAENLQASCSLAGRLCSESDASDALVRAGLQGRERLPVRLLSQGQRKRAALSFLAVFAEAGLWVLDEPVDGLDTTAVDWLLGLIKGQLSRGGVVVLTQHQDSLLDECPASVTIDLDTHRLSPAYA